MTYPDAVALHPGGRVSLVTTAPTSKSVTNRLLVIAALAEEETTLRSPLVCDDTDAMIDVIVGLGAKVSRRETTTGVLEWVVTGTGGVLATPETALSCRDSGTTIRFASALAALASEPVTLTGSPRLCRRPIRPLIDAVTQFGAIARDGVVPDMGEPTRGFPPVTVGGRDERTVLGGTVRVDASASSQFASAMLMIAPYADTDVTITVVGRHATAYVEMTEAAMRRGGVVTKRVEENVWHVPAGQRYDLGTLDVEYDASAAAHLFALAVATGGVVTVTNVTPTLQPDAGMLNVFARFGAGIDVTTVSETGHATVTVVGPPRPVSPGTVDLSTMPDQLPTVAALAALAEGQTTITNVGVTRGHETDRIAALVRELARLGTGVTEHAEGLTLDGTTTRTGATMNPHGDHRLAMAFSTVGARIDGVRIAEPGCVGKTFPTYWEKLRASGVKIRNGERNNE